MSALALLLAGALPLPAHGDGAPEKAASEIGHKVFTQTAQPSCAVCHTLKAAGAAGTVGPSLDELKPDLQRALQAIRNGVGVMPAYGDKLSTEEIEAVATYVAKVAGGGE